MAGRGAALAGFVIVALTLTSCDSTGTTRGGCRRLNDIIEDLENGDITSADELRQRYEDDLTFSDGSSLDDAKNDLLRHIEDGDEDRAVLATNFLLDRCAEILTQ